MLRNRNRAADVPKPDHKFHQIQNLSMLKFRLISYTNAKKTCQTFGLSRLEPSGIMGFSKKKKKNRV